jgi:hypothetical protein
MEKASGKHWENIGGARKSLGKAYKGKTSRADILGILSNSQADRTCHNSIPSSSPTRITVRSVAYPILILSRILGNSTDTKQDAQAKVE